MILLTKEPIFRCEGATSLHITDVRDKAMRDAGKVKAIVLCDGDDFLCSINMTEAEYTTLRQEIEIDRHKAAAAVKGAK